MNYTKLPEGINYNPDRLTYAASEVCAALGICSKTLLRLRQRKLIKPIAGLRIKRYAVAEVARFIASGDSAGAAE